MVIDAQREDLFDVQMTLRAFRDSRYQTTAYAIAELIDNSVDWDSRQVDVLFQEEQELVTERRYPRVSAIAVADNGSGMSANTLIQALKIGGRGTNPKRRAIGKYGVGLTTSSLSQCQRVDVWTWQQGLNSAWHCYLDVDEINSGNAQIPFPANDYPPAEWMDAARSEIRESATGTLVVWTKLDKVQQRRAETIMNHVEEGVGRIYRHFIYDDDVSIRMAFTDQNSESKMVKPNDPLYLMENSSTNAPWDNDSMFRPWSTRDFTVRADGVEYTVTVIYSIAKDEALRTDSPGQRAGNQPHGRHAGRNTGISVVRERRELVQLLPLVSRNDERNRWWGCEVQFVSGCDELFGVDHNKQMASHFQRIAEEFARSNDQSQRIVDSSEEDESRALYKVLADIRNETSAMLGQVGKRIKQLRPTPSSNGHGGSPESITEKVADDADKKAQEEGLRNTTETDLARLNTPSSERLNGHAQILIDSGMEEEPARREAERIVREDSRFKFISDQLVGSQLFSVKSQYGTLYVTLNINHPMYDLLQELEDAAIESQDDTLSGACIALRLLLSSWAANEDQYPESEQRRRVQNIALDWGRQAEIAFQVDQVRREG